MEFYENRSKRPFIAFVWVAKTLRNWYRINRTRRILSQMSDEIRGGEWRTKNAKAFHDKCENDTVPS